jgi:hypothetical protein
MSFDTASLWDATQLALLRTLTRFVSMVDALFDIRWGERLLQRLSKRWQTRLVQLDQDLAHLESERARLYKQAETLALHIAAVHLGVRYLVQEELRFDPSDPHDKETLDAAIDLLVKPRFALIEPHQVEPGRYVYYLEPDWPKISARLSEALGQEDPESPCWLLDGVEFIDQTFLSKLETTAE